MTFRNYHIFAVLFVAAMTLFSVARLDHWGWGWLFFFAFCSGQYWTQFWEYRRLER